MIFYIMTKKRQYYAKSYLIKWDYYFFISKCYDRMENVYILITSLMFIWMPLFVIK